MSDAKSSAVIRRIILVIGFLFIFIPAFWLAKGFVVNLCGYNEYLYFHLGDQSLVFWSGNGATHFALQTEPWESFDTEPEDLVLSVSYAYEVDVWIDNSLFSWFYEPNDGAMHLLPLSGSLSDNYWSVDIPGLLSLFLTAALAVLGYRLFAASDAQ